MSFNGSGVFVINSAGQPVVANTLIQASVFNAFTADVATGLSTCITKDGQTTITANIPMSGYKLTGLGAGSTNGDSVRFEQLASIPQDGLPTYLTSVAGTNTITGTATPTPAYAVGQRFVFIPAVTNTGAATLNISSVGAGAVQWAGAALTGGELVAGTPVTVLVTATTPVFEIINATQFPDTRALVVGGTDATKKLRFEVDGITTGTTRVITMPDKDVTLADATTTAGGLVELAIQSEVDAGTDATRAITPSLNRISLGTLQASTSGASIDFTGIPAGVRRVTCSLVAVSTNGTSDIIAQIGPSGGVETSGYAGAASIINVGVATTNYTVGFGVGPSAAAAHVFHGTFTLTLIESSTNTWSFTSAMGRSDAANMLVGAGAKALAGALSRLRITTVGGTAAFDAGSINITWER